jgi:prepilin-type N-terminal cleavage/methylation domain-containing protein/prepilin-type processing-associated H-X9-DG protein
MSQKNLALSNWGTCRVTHGRLAGFNLIELMVVIAIIGVLAAILFPVFSRVREKVRQSACQSNLRQIGMGLLQYIQDNDEKTPSGTQSNASLVGVGWAGQLLPYTKTRDIFKCASEGSRPTGFPTNTDLWTYRYNLGLRIDQNNWNTLSNTSDGPIVRMSMMTQPTVTVAVYESTPGPYALDVGEASSPVGNGYRWTQGACPSGTWSCGAPCRGSICGVLITNTSIDSHTRHSGGSNYLLMDGHVKWFKTEQVSFGFRAGPGTVPNAASDEAAWGGTNSIFAQGTEFSGPGKKTVTFSYK